MFQKILLAEDFDTINIAIAGALEKLAIPVTDQSAYCDEAFLKIKKAVQDQEPYDLLISDLSFKPGFGFSRIKSGIELIAAAKACDANLKVIVFSVENRVHPVKHLIEDLEIDGYVLKGRDNISEIQKAIRTIYDGGRYLSEEVNALLQNKSLNEIDAFDLRLLNLLASGHKNKDIAASLLSQGIIPNSESSVEKKINRLKNVLGANTTGQMLLLAKDLGLV